MSRKVVVTCALTGGFDTTSKNPAVPVSPEAIANSGLDAARSGAGVLHIHVRDPLSGKPSMAVEHYQEAVERIRARSKDVVINLTSGPGARFIPSHDDPTSPAPGTTLTTPERRMSHIESLRPEICSLDVGSMNFGPHLFIHTPGRVGLEDNLYLSAGKLAPSNAALVAKAVRIIEHLGCAIASPAEARALFAIGGRR